MTKEISFWNGKSSGFSTGKSIGDMAKTGVGIFMGLAFLGATVGLIKGIW